VSRATLITLLLIPASCTREPAPDGGLPANQAGGGSARRDDGPVPLDANPPVEYPVSLYQQRVSGTVLLRLFVNDSGRVIPESTRVQESSGYPAFDSAAIAAAPRLRYAPALRGGQPVAAAFVQPIQFRHPEQPSTSPPGTP
jgi:TonB family protein